MGSFANLRPRRVIWSFSSRAPISTSSCTPSLTALELGLSRNGKSATLPKPNALIWRMTEASEVRRISGSVNSGWEMWSRSEKRRTAMPGDVRPARPARCAADA